MYKVFYEDDDINIKWNVEIDGNLHIHLTLLRVNKSTIFTALEKWGEFRANAYFAGYESIYSYTPNIKVLRFFPPDEIVGEFEAGGINYKVVKWDLK